MGIHGNTWEYMGVHGSHHLGWGVRGSHHQGLGNKREFTREYRELLGVQEYYSSTLINRNIVHYLGWLLAPRYSICAGRHFIVGFCVCV